jgi:hypothetical protein
MQEDIKPPGFGQYVLAIILGLLAIAAGGISLSMNVAFGLKTGLVMAAIFALSDGAKIILPMIDAALGGSTPKRCLAYWTAVLISILAATSYLLETQATRLLQSQSASATASSARADAERIRSELALISEPLSLAALEKLEKEKRDAAQRESGRGGCKSICEGLNGEADAYLERLGLARRRDRLEAQLDETMRTVQAKPVEALGSADTLASLTGGDKAEIAQHEAIVKAVLMLTILEIIAMFSGDAGNLFVRTFQARKEAGQQQTEADEVVTKSSEISPKKPAASYWMQRLSKERPDIAARVIAGEISCYRGCLDAGIRKKPAKTWSKPEDFGIVREKT